MQKSVRPFLLDKFLICTCKPPVTCQKISKYGFDECYQSAIKWGILEIKNPVFMRVCGPSYPLFAYSHSIVAGGLLVMSYTIRLMWSTSLMIRLETFSNTS